MRFQVGCPLSVMVKVGGASGMGPAARVVEQRQARSRRLVGRRNFMREGKEWILTEGGRS
jgi:hypothetical protein